MASLALLPELLALTRRRWAVAVLAAVAGGAVARVPVLAAALGASRGGVAEALDHLIALGLLTRVPPPRHPLQAELALTPAGRVWAARAARLMPATGRLGFSAVLRDRWSLPVLVALVTPAGFGVLRRTLGATDRALALALAALTDAGLIEREVLTEQRPPATCYRLTPAALPLADVLAA